MAGDEDGASSILNSFPRLQSLHPELVPQIAIVAAGCNRSMFGGQRSSNSLRWGTERRWQGAEEPLCGRRRREVIHGGD